MALLDCTVVATIVEFNKINKYASFILMPYLGWTCFYSIISFIIWRRNKDKKLD